jgi:flagellar motor switch protein FliN/FliY
MEGNTGKSTAANGVTDRVVNENTMVQQELQDMEAGEHRQGATGGTNPMAGQTKLAGETKIDNLDFVLDIPMMLTVELGRSKMLINELLKLGRGSVIEMSKLAGEPLDILANQRLIARGEVVVVKEKYGIRITEIISPAERIERLQ